MGTMSFGEGDSGREGWPISYEDAVPFFRQALDLGITFWDTANGYNGGNRRRCRGAEGAQGQSCGNGVLRGARQ